MRSSAVERLYPAFELDQQGVALAVQRLASWHLDPTLADTVFNDVGALFIIEQNADVMLKNSRHMVRALKVN